MIYALYIDDEPNLLEIAKAFLEREGEILVDTATSAMEALIKLETTPYDAIICDFQMPMVDGLEFLKTLRLQGRNLPFILFTGRGREDVAIEALNNGADFYLQKGGDPKSQFVELQNMLRRSVDQRRAEEYAKDSEQIYEKLFKDNIEAMILVNPKTGRIEDANLAATRFSGYAREQLLASSVQELGLLPEGRTIQATGHAQIMGTSKLTMKFRCANGQPRDVEVFSGTLRVHGRSMGYALIHDITDSILAAKRERRLHLVFKALSDTGQLIIKARDEMELVAGTCRILVDQEEYDLAWIGARDSGDQVFRTVGLAARDGHVDTELRGILAAGSGPALEALSQRRAVTVHGALFSNNGRDFLSSVSLPLIMENEVKAILSIYSEKPDAFDSTEVGSLQELANNLSEALARMQSADSEMHGLENEDPVGRQLREIIDVSSKAFFLLDREGRVRLCNQRAREMLGQGGEGVIGRPFAGVLFEENASLHYAIGNSLMSKSPQTLTIHTEVPQPRRYDVELQPSAEGLGIFFDDVSQVMSHGSEPSDKNQRQLVEERLWETGGKLRAIIQTSPLAILSLDPDGSVSTWNPAAERIFDWEEVGSARPFSFLPEGSGEMEELKARILQGERLVDIEVVRKYPGGQERTVSISTAPILDQAGQVGGIIVVGSDTSERKRMEDRLIQLNEALRLVNGILRHDTLNELMVVNGSLDMYQKTKQEKFLETGRKAVGRSVEMIKRMKELESMAVSGGSLHEYDLHQVIEDILKGYMVEFQITGEARLFADNALPSAIDNIVRNAMIHGKADRIEAKIWQEGGFTYLSIADDGIGIPDSIKQRIFVEGFSYGNNAGSGLGLYLVSKTLERYGGKVRVEDNRPRGTTFVLSFPKNLAEMSAS